MSDEGGSGGTGSTWKSRFPVARIKKIMQADEDVGKVAQVTPVAICTLLPSLGAYASKANNDDYSESIRVVYGSDDQGCSRRNKGPGGKKSHSISFVRTIPLSAEHLRF
jgi:Histone-like transcription factor (CBF/NF-Y) and archaeal histone